MVWVIHVEIGEQRQADRFLLTAGDAAKHRGFTVGRPPARADSRPDIIVPEKSVSKIHAVLHVGAGTNDAAVPSRLYISDKSRFGTLINHKKMAQGVNQELRGGDMVQLAPKTFLIIEELRLVLAVRRGHPKLAEVREAAARAGAQLIDFYDSSSTTHVLYDPGDVIWSAVVHGAHRGVPFVGLDWLHRIGAAGLMVNSLPAPPHLETLLLGPGQPPARVPLPPSGTSCSGLLAGFTFGFSGTWQDVGLEVLLTELGGRVVSSPDGSVSDTPVVVLNEGSLVEHLLLHILTLDKAAVCQLISSAHDGGGSGKRREVAALDQEAALLGPEDLDMTQAAEEDDVEMDMDEQRPGARSGGQAEPHIPLLATEPNQLANKPGHPGTSDAGKGPQVEDGWLMVARRPEETTGQATTAVATNQACKQLANDIVHEDAPAPKRRRLLSSSLAQPSDSKVVGTANLLSAPVPFPPSNHFSRPTAPASITPLLKYPIPTKHEPVDDGEWMTQNPHGRTNRRTGGAMRGATLAPMLAVKDDPSAAPQLTWPPGPVSANTAKAKGRAGKAAATDLDQLGLGPRIKEEQPPVPEVLDASAQLVTEADLFAPTPEQLTQRCRSGSAEPFPGSACGLEVCEAELPDFKQFRKQGTQLLRDRVQPLPVFLVDNFQRTEETEAFLRMEEERANNKRRADEMFKNADIGPKKPARGPRRA